MCFVVLLGALVPRLTLFVLWIATTWTRVLHPWWLGLLGFLFLPYTTLAYVLISRVSGDVRLANPAHLILIIVTLFIDFGAWSGGHRHRRKKR